MRPSDQVARDSAAAAVVATDDLGLEGTSSLMCRSIQSPLKSLVILLLGLKLASCVVLAPYYLFDCDYGLLI